MHSFKNDYTALAHPRLLQALIDANHEQDEAYGLDRRSEAAAAHIKRHLGVHGEKAQVHMLCGGTQANLTALGFFLRPHEAVIATDTAHISVHETGAIEATGHKIIEVPTENAKLNPNHVQKVLDEHGNNVHMVKPRLVKISQSTELGLVYSLAELTALNRLCRENNLLLYVDGARLGSALVSQGSDVTLEGLSALTDAFYIGGTKNGALLGEAMVLMNDSLKADFPYAIKQRGAMLAKGRVLGAQFEELFRDGLFFELAGHATRMAQKLAAGLREAGYTFLTDSPSNQIFPILPDALIAQLSTQWPFNVWQGMGTEQHAIRLVAGWDTPETEVDAFLAVVRAFTK